MLEHFVLFLCAIFAIYLPPAHPQKVPHFRSGPHLSFQSVADSYL